MLKKHLCYSAKLWLSQCQFRTVASSMTGLFAAIHLLIATCCYLGGPALSRGVPALRKKEHGNSILVTCLLYFYYYFTSRLLIFYI